MENQSVVEHLFRREYGKLVSVLTSKYTSNKIDLIEDAVQEALLKAMTLWSFNPIPANATGWLYKVADNYIIDSLRKSSKYVTYEYEEDNEAVVDEEYISSGLKDEQLKMIFACCHPSMSQSDQIMLSLKLLCGFSNVEISSALIKNEETVKRALTRAKEKFKINVKLLEVPGENELPSRMDSVLKVIYLLFNEGYKAADSEQLIRKELCEESIRLANLLLKTKNTNIPALNALLSLMHFNFSRFDARIDDNNNLVTLEFQNRLLWNTNHINLGFYYLNQSAKGNSLSEYHFEAAIASYYTAAGSFEETDWKSIKELYDNLLTINDSPVVRLNRAVVISKCEGIKRALEELEILGLEKSLNSNYLFYTIKADFENSLGNSGSAKIDYEKAMRLTNNKIEQKYLAGKLDQLQ